MRKRKHPKGRVVKHTLADGSTRVYRYGTYQPKRRAVGPDSLEALIRAYRRSPEWNALRPHTREVYSVYLKPLEEVGHLAVSSLGRREILILRDGIAAGRGTGAATGFMRAASALFTWAVKHDWIERSPVTGIEALKGGELRAWTRQEADHAEAQLPEHLRRVVILARYTAARRGDLCAMPWLAYDGRAIRYVPEKTKRASPAPLVIPCHAILKAELDKWRALARSPAAPILTNTLGRAWKPQHLSHELPTALVRIGLSRSLNVHGLRKLAATELADAGCTTFEVASVTGHRTLAMLQHYTRTADQERLSASAFEKLQNRRE